jgi:phosphoenolpyruvate phosphomutase
MIPDAWQQKLSVGESVVLIGAHNPMSAYIGSQAGFDGIWWSSFEISSSFALPDASLVWPDEITFMLSKATSKLSLPHVVDVDAGYGSPNQLVLAVDRFRAAGASAICVEDQVHPKINSLAPGVHRRLCHINEMVDRIVALRRNADPGLGVFARVESFIVGEGVEKALERANAYAEAGADAIVVHSAKSEIRELADFSNRWHHERPLIAIPTTYGSFGVNQLSQMGFSIVIFANVLVRSAIKAMMEAARRLKESKTLSTIEPELIGFGEVREMLDYKGLATSQSSDCKWEPPEQSQSLP